MNVLLVSMRGDDPAAVASRARCGTLAASLLAAGDVVRWLCPLAPGEPPPAVDGVRLRGSVGKTPPFRAVESRLDDPELELALAEELRDDPATVVHLEGFGGGSSYSTAWLADRLGVPVLIVARPFEPLVCHRGTLVDQTGAACVVFDDPDRCMACVCTRWEHGLGPLAAWLAKVLRPLGGWSPFPSRMQFENRIEKVMQGLASARRVLVQDPSHVPILVSLGVPQRAVEIGIPADHDVDAWRERYARAIAG